MPIKISTALFIILFSSNSLAHPPERCQQGTSASTQEAVTLNFTLNSGLHARGIIYRRERLGGNWILQIKSNSGANFVPEEAASIKSINQDEFIEIINSALANIHELHEGRLDYIHIGADLVDSFWSGALAHLRALPISPDEEVVQQSRSISDGLVRYVSHSPFVEAICGQTRNFGLECNGQSISMDPVAFQPQYLGKKWGYVKNLPDAGIQASELWYSISLKKVEQR
ncbi:hypothetical protein LDO32_01620 [Luteimonas sp. Y-2-2-4F]|nr:hypothetical protein [Luteimonas sp. Y-2-2-4F]MCD9030433.1 hypothetical protein [Luteimonas sp. Y-2-2-4F]